MGHSFLVHPTDTVRIDLKIPPDQYIYLRAATPAERQQWLVALGTAKACLTAMKQNGHSEMPGECKSLYNHIGFSVGTICMLRCIHKQ